MVNINDCVQFIKTRLGYPNVSIELDDATIAQIIRYEALLLFEQYCPDVGNYSFSKNSKKYKIKRNLYWVIDKNDREVFWVQSVVPEQSELLANQYPYTMPLIGYDSVPDALDQMNRAHIQMQWGRQLTWWQEEQTNRVWIFSEEGLSGRYIITYTRSHAPDLSTISREYAIDFNNIALGFVMMAIGNTRTKYSTIGTPVGDIQVGGSELISQGQELINTTVEKLNTTKPRFIQLEVR